MTGATDNLRFALREATARSHDMLDATMQAAAGWHTQDDYARFLSLQYSARWPVETWLELNAPREIIPPSQAALIGSDLSRLGVAVPSVGLGFGLDKQLSTASKASAALGVAWVLAGSSLGNRAILAEIKRKTPANRVWPHSFLGDEAMLSFWKRLRQSIERPADADEVKAASEAARTVFDHFLAIASPAASESSQRPSLAGSVS